MSVQTVNELNDQAMNELNDQPGNGGEPIRKVTAVVIGAGQRGFAYSAYSIDYPDQLQVFILFNHLTVSLYVNNIY